MAASGLAGSRQRASALSALSAAIRDCPAQALQALQAQRGPATAGSAAQRSTATRRSVSVCFSRTDCPSGYRCPDLSARHYDAGLGQRGRRAGKPAAPPGFHNKNRAQRCAGPNEVQMEMTFKRKPAF